MITRRAILAGGAALGAASADAAAADPASEAVRVRILSIDGGGMKGVIPATILAALQAKRLALGKSGVEDCFDLFAGTSTGSIIAAALASASVVRDHKGRQVVHPDEMIGIYRDKGPSIFKAHSALKERLVKNPIDWWGQSYSSRGKEAAFLETYGDTLLGDLGKDFVATYYEMSPTPQAVIASAGPLFRKARKADYDDLLLRDVVDASSAAPIFFNPAEIGQPRVRAVDGGIFANNPAAAAYFSAAAALAAAYPDKRTEIEIVALGCGATTVEYSDKIATWGPAEWVLPKRGVPLMTLVSDSQASAIDKQLSGYLGARYERYQPVLPPLRDRNRRPLGRMDDGRAVNVEALHGVAKAFVETPKISQRLDALAARL